MGAACLLVFISVGVLVASQEEPILQRWVGFLFLALLGWYLYMTYSWAKQGKELEADDDEEGGEVKLAMAWVMLLGGLFLVLLGARALVPCASELAFRMRVPEDVIAATMVAFGTSLPELMTAIAAVRKGHPEITVGNIVGADVLNCLFVIGAAASAKPLAIPSNFYLFHFPTMLFILFSFRFFIFKNTDGRFKRYQGAWLLSIYLVYLVLQYGFNIGTIEG